MIASVDFIFLQNIFCCIRALSKTISKVWLFGELYCQYLRAYLVWVRIAPNADRNHHWNQVDICISGSCWGPGSHHVDRATPAAQCIYLLWGKRGRKHVNCVRKQFTCLCSHCGVTELMCCALLNPLTNSHSWQIEWHAATWLSHLFLSVAVTYKLSLNHNCI